LVSLLSDLGAKNPAEEGSKVMSKLLTIFLVVFSALSSRGVSSIQTAAPRKGDDPKIQEDYYARFRPEHKRVLSKWLANKPSLRPAVESDCTDKEYLEITRRDWGKQFDPYYVVADFNRDGKKDFAVLLVDSKNADENGFAIAIFNAPFAGKTNPNYFERGYIGIGNAYIVYNDMIKRRLYLGIYESDFYCVTFYPKKTKYIFRDLVD
jgi:hypothetical protein